MRYTDVLLKQKSPSLEAQEEANERDLRQRLDAMSAEAQSLQTLKQHPGWQAFEAALRNEELSLLSLMERASDPTTLAKVAGSLLVIRSFQTWADDRANELLAAIEDAVE